MTSELPPIIFLDFDGVLNSARTVYASEGAGYFYLDPVAIRLVNKICDMTGAKIVVSSTWRLNYKNFALMHLMKIAGFKPKDFYQSAFYTPYSRLSGHRGEDVRGWTDENGMPDKLCCIDDRRDFYEWQNLVNTDSRIGLSIEDFWKAVKFLGGNVDDVPIMF